MNPQSPPPFQRRTIQTPDSPQLTSPRKKIDFSQMVLPKGNKLILRGVYITDAATHDPVKLAKVAVDRLRRADPQLEAIPVVIASFSERFPSTSVAYLALHSSLASVTDSEPRCDLLDKWRIALEADQPTWEITWAPANEGIDKRMWVRFPTVVAELEKKMDKQPGKEDVVKTSVRNGSP
ncbi:hypothetical protein B0H13DRAFT_1850077 [Mycena leptocephala]|nr:hypothetical protein B0H13DRAFT_1850077 [Mycena leptocephala]